MQPPGLTPEQAAMLAQMTKNTPLDPEYMKQVQAQLGGGQPVNGLGGAPLQGVIRLEDCRVEDCILTRWACFVPPPLAPAMATPMTWMT